MSDPHSRLSLYLVQHGEAVAETVDPERPLSAAGRAVVALVATWAAQRGVAVERIRHSGKLRAEQTATIFAEKLRPRQGVSVQVGVGPNDDVRPVAKTLATESGSLMLVGHLPFLSRLAGFLLTGEGERQLLEFRYGGLIGLVREHDKWAIRCVIPPDLAALE